jgi:hypothetical protein
MSLVVGRAARPVQSPWAVPPYNGWEEFDQDLPPGTPITTLDRIYNESSGEEIQVAFKSLIDRYFPEEPAVVSDLKLAIGELFNNTIQHGLPGSTRHATLMVFRGPVVVLRTENLPNPTDRRHTCPRSRISSLPEKEPTAQLSVEDMAKALDILEAEIDSSGKLLQSLNMGYLILDQLPCVAIELMKHLDEHDNMFRCQVVMPKRSRLSCQSTYAC